VNKTYMLDTNICSFIMREQPEAVLKRLEQAVLRGHRIVVSAITYSEMRFGATGRRPRRATSSWSTRSAPASMPSCPGTALRWTPPRRLRWRCASPERR
jgi:tRNA(fMet)-specific endonuclease VapC